jgi:hypothetical protein
LPALRAQYLLAGAVPLVVIAVVAFLIAGIRALFDHIATRRPWQRVAVAWCFVIAGTAAAAYELVPAVSGIYSPIIRDRALRIAYVALALGLVYGGYALLAPGIFGSARLLPVYGTPLGWVSLRS